MTAYTPNFELPYPTALDAPCDFAEQWCAFTDAVQGVLDTFQAAVDRTWPVAPIAQVRITTPLSIVDSGGGSGNLAFDTVSVDTAGWVDFDSDPSSLLINRAGRFYLHSNAMYDITTSDNTFINQTIFGEATTGLPDQRRDPGLGVDVAGETMFTPVNTTTTSYRVLVAETLSADNVLIVDEAYFTAVWVADGATP